MSALPNLPSPAPWSVRCFHCCRRRPALLVLSLFVCLVLAGFAGCSDSVQADPADPSDRAGTGRDTAQELRRLVVTVVESDSAQSAQGAPERESAAALAERVRGGGFFRWYANRLEGWSSEVRTGGAAESAEEAPEIEVVVGLLPLPKEVHVLAADLPVILDGATVGLGGTTYPDPSTTVTVRLPPAGGERPGAGAGPERWLVAGGEAEHLARAVDQALVQAVRQRLAEPGLAESEKIQRIDYVVQETEWLRRTGAWRVADGQWEPDPDSETDEIAERNRWFRGLVPVGEGSVRLLAPPEASDDAELRGLAEELGEAVDSMVRRLGVERAPEAGASRAPSAEAPVTVVLEEDYVAQIRHTGRLGVAVDGTGGGLHAVLHPDDLWALRHALARHLLERAGLTEGRPVWAVEGTALWLAEGKASRWYGQPYPDWLPALVAAGALPSGAELLAAERQGADSAPLWTPVAAVVVEGLPGTTAAAKLAAFADLDERAAEDRLGRLRERVAAAEPRARPAPVAPPAGFLRGVSLAHPNSLDGGYHAPFIDRRLAELRELGVDSVSLMPFAYQRDPRAPEMTFLNRTPLSEHDTGTIHAARAAHARGLSVLWKPHIWVAHDSWPGEIEMDSEEEWAAWWRLYRRFVLHHALLARYAGAELFSVGVELERTVERPEWAELITAVRQLYPGPVTYAANWGSGADRARFWDRVDLVGVDAYYPLTGSADDGSPERLRSGAAQVAARLRGLSERTGKPVLLTEVGFAARRGAWVAPHEQGGEYSGEDQARAYDALFGALRGSMADGTWLRGVYVWKAFSGDRAWRVAQADFRFLGRPAEEVVGRYFRRGGQTAGATP